jgi:peptidoglycan hydrolase-like protein with peptidoglycan-binding domain
MGWKSMVVVIVLTYLQAGLTFADELTKIVQQDLATLGYDPGTADGSSTTKTIIAVSKFQSEHNMEVTGEITPQLAGVIQAAISRKNSPTSTAQPAAAVQNQMTPAQAQADLKARQQACLQKKVDDAQKSAQMKSGFGKLFNAVSRTTSRFVGGDTAAQIATTTGDINSVNASLNDLEGAAKDLGISDSDIEACQNP